jgi:ferrous iron transport protein A
MAAAKKRSIPLRQLEAGQSAHISAIVGHPDHVHRLEEFGLRGGMQIEMFRPGNPCILRMAGNKFCLRADDLLDIQVTPLGTAE